MCPEHVRGCPVTGFAGRAGPPEALRATDLPRKVVPETQVVVVSCRPKQGKLASLRAAPVVTGSRSGPPGWFDGGKIPPAAAGHSLSDANDYLAYACCHA